MKDVASVEVSDLWNGHIRSRRKVLLRYKSRPLPEAMLFISSRARPYSPQSGVASELRSDHQLILSEAWDLELLLTTPAQKMFWKAET
jgi:hypothetical protein